MYFAYPSYFIDFSIFNYIVISLFCIIVTVGILLHFLGLLYVSLHFCCTHIATEEDSLVAVETFGFIYFLLLTSVKD